MVNPDRKQSAKDALTRYRASQTIRPSMPTPTPWHVVLHRVSTGDSLVMGEYPILEVAQIMQRDIESRLSFWGEAFKVYILPVGGN